MGVIFIVVVDFITLIGVIVVFVTIIGMIVVVVLVISLAHHFKIFYSSNLSFLSSECLAAHPAQQVVWVADAKVSNHAVSACISPDIVIYSIVL